jgi:hypothetical protein
MKSHGGKGQPKSLAAAFLAFARTSGGGEDMGYMYNFNSEYVHMY